MSDRGAQLGAIAVASLLAACAQSEPADPPPAPRVALSSPPPVATALPEAAAPSASASAAPAVPPSLVREEREIVVAGKKERWRLEWQRAPEYDCFESMCPCENVRYGERGPLLLFRAREGAPEKRLDLGDRALQRWPVFEADSERTRGVVDANLPLVKDRPVVTIMHFGDYDRDGRETEFVLDRGDSPCSMHSAIVVGALGGSDELRILSLAGHPDTPIDLNGRWQWERVRRASDAALEAGIELTQFGCGNHGSGEEVSYVVRRTAAGLDVTVRRYACDAQFRRLPKFTESPYRREGGR